MKYEIEVRRPERLAEVLREEITEIVGYELDDPRLLSVTVTDVRVSDNLRDAKIFVTVQGTEHEIKEALKALQHAATFIRQQVALSLDLRHAPHLNFVRDTVEENASRIEEVIQSLAQKGEFQERNEIEN
jgi:ribosome-binding factor A